MAYGVKFRLEFSDDNLKGKKLKFFKMDILDQF